MDGDRFDRMLSVFATRMSGDRRRVLRGLVSIALGLTWSELPDAIEAKHKPKKKPKFNEFDCVDVGGYCQKRSQCCSNVCKGNTCRAHDTGGCTKGHIVCGAGTPQSCTTSTFNGGACQTTTGNGLYCAAAGDASVSCKKDTDCRKRFGKLAACARCPTVPSKAYCLGPTFEG